MRRFFSVIPTSLLAAFVAFSASSLCWADDSSVTPIATEFSINTEDQLGEYRGFGIGIHPGDVIYSEAFDELDLEYVRMELGPVWYDLAEQIPAGVSVAELQAFIERNYNGDAYNRLEGARYTHGFLRARDIQLILIHFELPYHWRAQGGLGVFLSEHIDDLARFYAAHLLFLESHGVQIDYIELANEPDGHWNGLVTPADYARLVKSCREIFDENGLHAVKILGPGLAFLNLYGKTPAYLSALGQDASDALFGWSMHTWDEVEFVQSNPEYAYGVWQPFFDGIYKTDPDGTKPLFLTEYGSDVTHYGGVDYASPRVQVAETVVDTWDYALRVMANSINHLNRGVNALVLYRLSNAHWHKTGWGIIQPETAETFQRKPVFWAVRDFIADLPTEVEVLSPSWYQSNDAVVYSVFLDHANKELTVLMANWTGHTQSESLRFADLPGLKLLEKKGRNEVGRFQPEFSQSDSECGAGFSVELPERSIIRLSFTFE